MGFVTPMMSGTVRNDRKVLRSPKSKFPRESLGPGLLLGRKWHLHRHRVSYDGGVATGTLIQERERASKPCESTRIRRFASGIRAAFSSQVH